MLNHITIMGRVVRKPELRYTSNNTATTTVTLACDRDFVAQGQQRATDFVDCVIWRQGAEFVNKYFDKGDLMVATGRLQFREWEDREGNKRRNAEVLVEHVYFGTNKRESGNGEDRTQRHNERSGASDDNGFYEDVDSSDGELPF